MTTRLNIHMVTIAYGLAEDSRTLFESAVSRPHDVHWHIFLHSTYPDVMQVCKDFARRNRNVTLYPYGTNRGVANSWNEGMLHAYTQGADVVIVSNDDCVPAEGDLTALAEAAYEQQNCFMVTCHGFDKGLNAEGSMRYGFWAWNKVALNTIGVMDENFFPMYWEDVDYSYRAKRVGLNIGHCPDTYVIHQGSKSIHTVPGLIDQHYITLARNEAYYLRKWGGGRNAEYYTRPFNDPRFTCYIHPQDRHAPYAEYNRMDFDVVGM